MNDVPPRPRRRGLRLAAALVAILGGYIGCYGVLRSERRLVRYWCDGTPGNQMIIASSGRACLSNTGHLYYLPGFTNWVSSNPELEKDDLAFVFAPLGRGEAALRQWWWRYDYDGYRRAVARLDAAFGREP